MTRVRTLLQGFIASSRQKLENHLTLESSKRLFKNIMENPDNKDPSKFAEIVTNTILKCVSDSGIKRVTKPKNKRAEKADKPWFDDECKKLKKRVSTISKKYQRFA